MLAKKLKETRLQKGFTQKEIADLLNVTQSSYSNWESGKAKPLRKNIKKIAKILEVSPEYLLGRDLNKSENVFYGDKHTINDNSQFKNNEGHIDISFSNNERSNNEIADDKNVISLLEQLVKNQELIINLLKNK